ncbi:MAG: hypothetical protein MR794_06930 [Bacteroidales bacterium]|nr:hypothetical protein [Bacteroidales bacterium]
MSHKMILSSAIDANPTSQRTYDLLLDEQLMKVLFHAGTPLSVDSICSALKPHKIYVNPDDVRQSVGRLIQHGYIPEKCKGNSIFLSDKGKRITQQKNDKYVYTFDVLINRYFSRGIDVERGIVEEWLRQVLLAIFQQYYQVVLSYITNQERINIEQLDIDKLHQSIVGKFDISSDNSQILRNQLKEMLTNGNDPEVIYIHYYFLNSCYASQVLTTKSHALTSIAAAFTNKTILLDTNVLITLQLEKKNQSHIDFAIVNDVCKKLNINLKYLQQTASEYSRVVSYKRSEYSDIVAGLSSNVLNKTRYDNILHTLRINGCYSPEKVEKFFDDNLIGIPAALGENLTSIECIPDEESYAPFEYYKRNSDDKENLRKIFSSTNFDDYDQDDESMLAEKNVIKKRDGVVEHDLGLIGYVRTERGAGEYARQHNKEIRDDIILITMDTSLLSYAKEQYPNETFVYSLRDIITWLALDKGGLLGNPEDFAPMLSSFVNNHFLIWEDTFGIPELSLIMDLEREVASLDEVKVVEISKELHKMRMQHKSKLDIHAYLQGELHVEYNKLNTEKIKLIDETQRQQREIKEKDKLLQKKDDELEQFREEKRQQRKNDFDDAYNKEYTRRNGGRWLIKCVYIVGISILIICLLSVGLHLLRKCDCVVQWFNQQHIYVQYIINNPLVVSSTKTKAIISMISGVFTALGIREEKKRDKEGFYEEPAITDAVLKKMKISKDKDDYIQNGL